MIINEKDLAKFGYRADMKVNFFKESLIILVPCWNLVLKKSVNNFFFPEIWQIKGLFGFLKNLCMCQNSIFQV